MIKEDIVKKEEYGSEDIRWDLSEFFSGITDPKIEETIKAVRKQSEDFVLTYKNKLKDLSANDLSQAYCLLESLLTPLYKLSQYVSLIYSTNTDDDQVKALVARVDDVESEISNLLLFFELELGAMPDDYFSKLDGAPELENFAYSLFMTRKTAKYNLSEEVEQVINLKDLVGANAHSKLYNELTSSFKFEFEIDGEVKSMNGSELRALRQHEDKDVRRRAMKLFFDKYEDNKLVLTHLYNNIIKDYGIEKNLRGYASAISIRNVGQDLDDKAVAVLHEVTKKSSFLVNRYYKLKAKILNLPDMSLADIYAPLPECTKRYTWEEAKEIVLEAFMAFDEDFYSMAKLMFDEHRVDAPVEMGKRGGAFCSSSVPELKPYVLLNFLGKPRDVATMAHELGHAIHSILCSKQNLTNFHPILPFAETASIFSEMVVTDLLLKKETDAKAKLSLLTHKLEDIFASSHRQNMFSQFELLTHDKIPDRIMSSAELCSSYKEELKGMFGDAVSYPDEYQWEWAAIPHIYEWPFYVYSYNFANLLVIALYQEYLEEGSDFVPGLKQFLSAGSAKSPEAIAEFVDVDIKDKAFWEKSLKYIEKLIDEVEELTK
jgi:oligoendopeptidase F